MYFKRILTAILTVCLVVTSFGALSFTSLAATGTGVKDDPIIIKNEQDFVDYFSSPASNSDKYFKLSTNLDLTGTSYLPTTSKFMSFDGQGHTIKLDISSSGNASLFGKWYPDNTNGTRELKNLTITGNVAGTGDVSAGFVVAVERGGTYNFDKLINRATVSGKRGVGGIAGRMEGSGAVVINMTDCENHGSITSSGNAFGAVGGIIGFVADGNTPNHTVNIVNCKNYGKISSEVNAGGIAGRLAKDTARKFTVSITNCANYGEIAASATGSGFAGIVGYSQGNADSSLFISKCYNAGKISGYDGRYTSGIVGRSDIKLTIEESYNAGIVSETAGNSFKGAMVGYNLPAESSILNCYNTGNFETSGTNSQPMYSLKDDSVIVTTSGLYYLEGLNIGASITNATEITDSELKTSLPSGFSSDIWDFIPMTDASDYYKYPQIKSNPYYYDFILLKDCESENYTYNYFIPSAEIEGTLHGANLIDFKDGISIYSVLGNGKLISPYGTYPELYETSLILDDTTSGVSINKSAVIFAVTKSSAKDDDGFSPVLSKEGKNARLSLKDGTQLYISSKIYYVKENEENITFPEAEAFFIKWIDSVTLTVSDILHGTVKINNEILDDEEYVFPKGSELEITVIPDNEYYLDTLKVNNADLISDKLEETTESYVIDKDSNLNANFIKYDLDRKITEDRKEESGVIVQTFKVHGNAGTMAEGKKIAVEFIKNSTLVDSDYSIVGADGSYAIIMDGSYSSGDYTIKVTLEIANSNILTFYITDEEKDTFYITSPESLNDLLIQINNNKETIVVDDLASEICDDSDLAFETDVFEELDFSIQRTIVNRFLDNNEYTVANIYERFDAAVIFETLKNSSITEDTVKNILDVYKKYIDIENEKIYTEVFLNLVNKNSVYSLLKGQNYQTYQDITNQFNYASIKEKLINVINYMEIMPVLSLYKTELNLESEVDLYDNFVPLKQDRCADYIFKNLKNTTTYSELKSLYQNAISQANLYIPPVINQGGSAPSGGGSSNVKVEPSYVEENKSSYETIGTTLMSDINEADWASEAIYELVDKNIIKGYDDGKFRPLNNITRAEFIKLVVTAFEFNLDVNSGEFDDVRPSDWHYQYIKKATENGLVRGKTDNMFMPDDLITRQEMTVILHRVIFKYNKINRASEINLDFTDADMIADYAIKSVMMLSEMKLLNGFPDGSFGPLLNTTRAEAAYLVYTVLNFINE